MTSGGNGPEAVLEAIGRLGLIALVRSPSETDALAVSRVLVAAGVGALEITFTTPGAVEVIATLQAEVDAAVLVGAGTIRSADEAQRAADAGADFLVAPGSPDRLVEALLATGRLAVPGVLTPTELMRVRLCGARLVKLFPASMLGPAGLQSLRGPFPEVAFVPTGGITPDQVLTWLGAGAHAVGIGSALAPPHLRGPGAAADLERRARRLVELLEARPHPASG